MSGPFPKPRVLIAARDPAVRRSIRLALAQVAECAEADCADAALAALERERPDLCFLDADHGRAGGGAGESIRRLVERTNVVVLTRAPKEEELLQAVRAGAIGYVSEGIDPRRLPLLVQGLIEGEAAVPRRLVRRLLDEVRSLGARTIATSDGRGIELTRREGEVLDLLRDGLPTRSIATRLGISEVTVRRHRSTLFAKFGTTSGDDLLRLLGAAEAKQPASA